ncbi:thyrotropin-releasing hormone-degrading ectoenzyme isoform X2 [Xylocopa sonorina]|uniref:thyrotropin-releasing hormone-degrading ectoenzyme isoform X2 n=1 Tax=Xylocopa sonorina TaxID=1818115 RepID=UPI00403ABCA0
MSRGSISSWQDYGRRSSQSMPQFSGGPVQFMTCDDMEYKRGDGWFLSYTKIAGIVVVFIIGVVAAGFLGWYITSLPKKKPYEALDLLNDGMENADNAGETVVSPFVHPSKYRLELTPIIDASGPSKLMGRVVINFHVNDTAGLDKLFLNGKNITVTSYKLLLLDLAGEDKKRTKKRRRRRGSDGTNYYALSDDTLLVSDTVYSVENDVEIMLTENDTTDEKNSESSSKNASSVGESKDSSLSYAEKIKEYDVNEDTEVHTIQLGTRIQQGVYSLEIEYEAIIDENAFFVANYSSPDEGRWLMGTNLRYSGARHLFPVFDDTMQKSVFSVSVARPKETRALSNMPVRTLRDASDNSTVDIFDDSPPLSPHNLAFVMGHIEATGTTLIGGNGTVVTLWCDSNRRSREIYLFDKLNPVVINLIDLFSMPYPLPKLDLVSLPPGIDENIGNLGLIGIKQSLFHTTNQSPLVTKTNALRVLVTLMGQQWFDEFTNVNRTDAWVFEGSLIHFQHEIVRKIDPSSDWSDSFVVDVQSQMMEIDGYSISRPLLESVNHRLLQSLNDEYAKGACLIRMLCAAISDTAFRNGYKKLITRWRYDGTDAADFMNILEEEVTELPAEISLVETMNSWTSQGGYPLVTVVRNYEDESAVIYQEQFSLDRPQESVSKFWHVPLNYVNEHGNWSTPTKLWFPSEPMISLDNVGSNDTWVLFNVNRTGYYRVHYDERNWMLLKTAVTEDHELFPAETRASLIDDVFNLAAIGLMKYRTAFDFINYMQTKERHSLPWSALMRHMLKLNRLLYETSIYSAFQEFAVRFVSPLYSEVGSRVREGSQLTMIAIRLACVFDHVDCVDWSRSVFEKARADDEIEETVPSYIRETVYCTIARYGTRKEWNYFMEKVTSVEDEEEKKRLLSSFACFQAPWILQSILNEILREGRFSPDEISVILKAFPRNPAAAQVASRFVRANWQEIAQRFAGSYSVLKSFVLSMINGLTTEQDLEDLEIFRENNYESMKGARYAAALVEANGNFETSWLKHSLPEIENILKERVE